MHMSETAEVWVALGVLGPLVVLAWVLFLKRRARDRRLASEGVTAGGRLTEVRGVTSAQGYRTTVVHYAFDAPLPGGTEVKTWKGKGILGMGVVHRPAEGSPVTIVHLPTDPSVNAIAGNPGGGGMWVIVLAILTGLLALVGSQLF